jgi:hypothetical protein
MSIIQTLAEGIVNRDMKKEGSALLSKWGKTGLLEGLQSEQQKSTMARLLENQAKELLREANTMTSSDVEGFAAVAFPIVRRVFAGLIANDLVSVQPMSLPSGLIFFLDFTFGADMNNTAVTVDRFGNAADASIYGTDKVAAGIATGVNLEGTYAEDLSGPGRAGMVGYAYSSPTGSHAMAAGEAAGLALLRASMTDAQKKLVKYDPDLLSDADVTSIYVVDGLTAAEIDGNSGSTADFENLAAFTLELSGASSGLNKEFTSFTGLATDAAAGNLKQIRRLTQKYKSGSSVLYRFVFSGPTTSGVANGTADAGGNQSVTANWPHTDLIDTTPGTQGAIAGFNYPLEGNSDIPEIDIKVDSIAITAQTKKLKAKWSPELGQDLNAYHNLDAEVELTSILSEQIALEIDREILADLVNGATAATYYWSRSPGLFVNRSTGAEIGASSAAPDFTGTVSEWYETLIETINDVSAQIHRKTLRGGANYVVVSPEVANILEFTSGFRANVTADADKGEIGAVKTGSLSRKFDVIVDPYFPRNVILVGRKGNSFLESGYVYAPYVPLQTTPTIFGVEDFVPRKGVMTRYAKKMVRPDMYGLVIVRGLLGEAGATS